MSAVIVPGMLPGLAPAAEGPPTSTGSPVTGKTFADTVAAHRAASDAANAAADRADANEADQAASEPNAPPGDPTAEPSAAEQTGVLVLIRNLLADATGDGGKTEATEVPLPDRSAGAGETEKTNATDANAMEALMAQTLITRVPVPTEDMTTTPAVPVVAPPVAAVGSEVPSSLDGLQQAVADLSAMTGGASSTTTNAAANAARAADAAAFQQSMNARLDASTAAPAAPVLSAPASTAASTATNAVAQAMAATAAQALAEGDASLKASTPRVAEAATSEPIEAPTTTVIDASDVVLSQAPAVQSDLPAAGNGEPKARRTVGQTIAETAAAARNVQPDSAGHSDIAALSSSGTRAEVATGGAVTTQIATTVQSAVLRGEHEVRLVLNPPELGRVEILITESTGGVRVHMLADQPGARDLIERQLPMLQQALAAREILVERLEVGRPGESASAQQWSNSQGSNDGQRQRGQQDGSTPDWSPLAAMGLGNTTGARVDRPRVVSTSGLDVMA